MMTENQGGDVKKKLKAGEGEVQDGKMREREAGQVYGCCYAEM